MKRYLTFLTVLTLCFCFLFAFACGKTEDKDTEKAQITVYAPDGAPAIAVAKFIHDKEDFGTDAEVTYNVVSAANIGGAMQKGPTVNGSGTSVYSLGT